MEEVGNKPTAQPATDQRSRIEMAIENNQWTKRLGLDELIASEVGRRKLDDAGAGRNSGRGEAINNAPIHDIGLQKWFESQSIN
jgi:hypothetical protein